MGGECQVMVGGGGVFKGKLLDEKYKANLDFPGGVSEGVQNKRPSMGGGLDIFWNYMTVHNAVLIMNINFGPSDNLFLFSFR